MTVLYNLSRYSQGKSNATRLPAVLHVRTGLVQRCLTSKHTHVIWMFHNWHEYQPSKNNFGKRLTGRAIREPVVGRW